MLTDDRVDFADMFGAAEPVEQAGPMFTYSTPEMPWPRRTLIRAVERLSGRAGFERLYRDWQKKSRDPEASVFTQAIAALGLQADVSAEDLAKIPAEGPLLVVSNHPFGIVDGLFIGHLIATVRKDVKLICHSLLCQPREAQDILLPIDFGPGPEARRVSAETRRRSVDWLDQGHVLIIFPAGGVATSVTPFAATAGDFEWHPFVARLARRAGVQTLALYVAGRNSRLFQVVSHLSYPLRVALIFFETRRRLHKPVTVRVAAPVECASMGKGDVVAWLRARTFAMAEPGGPKAEEVFAFPERITF
jgi:putative hemolysin